MQIFAVIQKIQLKKPNPYGSSKELLVESYTFGDNGITKRKYCYTQSTEKFDRPIKTAYKITIHESYRENGKVKKKQYYIGTIDYYSMTEYCLADCISPHCIDDLANQLNIDQNILWEMINSKYEPLEQKVITEFHQSEEYLGRLRNNAILQKYRDTKAAFTKKYDCVEDEYDFCYDVFGTLMNAEYLKQIQKNYKTQKEYQKRSYQNSNQSNYSYNSYNSCYPNMSASYTDDERGYLKKFFKVLAVKYHPDTNQDKDTTKEMQLLNKLKSEWDV